MLHVFVLQKSPAIKINPLKIVSIKKTVKRFSTYLTLFDTEKLSTMRESELLLTFDAQE